MFISQFKQFIFPFVTMAVIFNYNSPQAIAEKPIIFQVERVGDSEVIQQGLGKPVKRSWDMRDFLAKSEWIFQKDGIVTISESKHNGFYKPIATYQGRYHTQGKMILFSGCNIDPDCRQVGDIISGYYSKFEGTVNLNNNPPMMIVNWMDLKHGIIIEHYRMRLILDTKRINQ